MFIRFQHLAILYIELGESVFASSVGGLRHSTTPGPTLMVGISHSATAGPSSTTMSKSILVNEHIRDGNWKGISLEEFESWIESEVDDLDSLRISGVGVIVLNRC